MRIARASSLISEEKTATWCDVCSLVLPWAMFWAMFMARDVLPWEGRAAMMISSDFLRPSILLSMLVMPVVRPAAPFSPAARRFILSIVSRRMSFQFLLVV